MNKNLVLLTLLGVVFSFPLHAQEAVAPQMPALEIIEEEVKPAVEVAKPEEPKPAAEPAPAPVKTPVSKKKKTSRKKKAATPTQDLTGKVAPEAKKALDAQAQVEVASVQAPLPAPEAAVATAQQPETKEGFVAKREEITEEEVKEKKEPRVVYNPKQHRDPTLSPDDFLLLQYREQQRLAAIEAERQRKLAEERRKREEAERLRQLELARIKDPTREVRNRIRVGGIIGQEVFIGDKIYTVGKSIYGARIVEVHPDEVVFSYKGHKFVRKVQLD